MDNAKDGVKRLGTLLTTMGAIGSLCAAITLYALEFHLTLRGWAEQVIPATQRLLATPEVIAHAKLLVLGLVLGAGSSLLLATGLGILIGAQAMLEAKQERLVPKHRVREVVAPRTSG